MNAQTWVPARKTRRGAVVITVAILLVVMVGMVAFAIDTGYICMVQAQLERACDAGSLAGVSQLATVPGQPQSPTGAYAEATRFAQLHGAGELGVVALRSADIGIRYLADPLDPASPVLMAPPPGENYNAVEVMLRRDSVSNGRLPLFFAPIFGANTTTVTAKVTAAILQANGILPDGNLLPYALRVDFYQAVRSGAAADPDGNPLDDAKTWDTATQTVANGRDGIKEIVMYGDNRTSPGNFGSIDIGSDSNGTPDLERQILDGPTQSDFEHADFPEGNDGEITAPFSTHGDTGLSAGVKDEFQSIIGQPRILPLYDTLTGQGNNANYHIVGFVGIVITEVNFQGNPKYVKMQPAFVVDSHLTPLRPGHGSPAPVIDGAYLPPTLVRLR